MKSVTHEKLPGYDSIGSELLQDHPQLVKEMASQCRTRFFLLYITSSCIKKIHYITFTTSPLHTILHSCHIYIL